LREDDTLMLQLKEKSKKYILISSSSTLTTEFMTLLADQMESLKFSETKRGLEYSISHFEDHFTSYQ
jgi:oligopeptidase B